jgi:hypothetical protein
MSLTIEFLGDDDQPSASFTVAERDSGYTLPAVRISADRSGVWVEECVVSGTNGEGLALAALEALTSIWQAASNVGATPLRSGRAMVPAAALRGPGEARVTWSVRYQQDGIYEGYVNDTDAQVAEATVELTFVAKRSDEPPGPARTEPASEPLTAEVPTVIVPVPERPDSDEPEHKGHVAIDFGTSNCTVTLLDFEILQPHVLSADQARSLRRSLVALMDEPRALGVGVQQELENCVADVASIVLDADGDGASLRRRLIQAIGSEDDLEPDLLYSTLVELERWVPRTSQELRPRLTNAVASMYERTWKVAPLDRLRLFPVELDIAEGVKLESKVSVTPSPWRVRVGKPLGLTAQDGQADPLVYAGLKQRLGQRKELPELGAGVTSDALLRDALGDLIKRTNAYIARGPGDLGTGRIDNVVITYPTMASPAMRHKLGDMLRELGISRIDLSYDEAVAAAMFFLLRDFAGDHDIGLEVLRARSRPTRRSDQWAQNLLVIDIGGGTADIALLTLTLIDSTPPELDPRLHGRYYELHPEVRGSTGLLQQGGELMTLRIFSWLKASIADRLHQALPERFRTEREQIKQITTDDVDDYPLTRWILRNKSSHGHPIHRVLDAIVPTMSELGVSHPEGTFWLLWTLAEQKKFELCEAADPAKVTVSAPEMRGVLRSIDQRGEAVVSLEQAPELADDNALEVDLALEKFESLIAPLLNMIVAAAYDLAEDRLLTPDGAEPLDRVVLTGQASQAPLVRRLVQASFAGADGAEEALRCRPTAIVVEKDYAKLATSVGSCWAATIRGLSHSPRGAMPQLLRGHNELYLDVKNLFFHLPCAFSVGTQPGGGDDKSRRPLLRMGAELYQLAPDSAVCAVRSQSAPWSELSDYVNVYREGFGPPLRRIASLWGAFQWEKEAGELRGGGWPRGINYLIEATSDLDLFILLSRGDRPHYLVGGPSVSAVARRPDVSAEMPAQVISPSAIVVDAYDSGGPHQGEQVFSAESGPDAFPEVFHGAADDSGMAGVIGKPLNEPTRNGVWTFHYRDENGTLRNLGELAPPPRSYDLRAEYFPTMDEQGNLRVHACCVPFWPAATLTDVQAQPGRVLRMRIPCPPKEADPAKDPFNGQH